jgi:hypothetical protein
MRFFTCIAILVLFFISSLHCTAQDYYGDSAKSMIKKKDKEPFWSWNRVYTGGGLGFSFGTITLVNVSPLIGYRLTKRYSAGLGATYIYLRDNRYKPPFELSIYGGSVFNRYQITRFLFLHGEYEALNGPWDFFSNRRFYIHNIWLGGGLSQSVGAGSYLYLLVLWNVNESIYSYPPSPQIRAGVAIGI